MDLEGAFLILLTWLVGLWDFIKGLRMKACWVKEIVVGLVWNLLERILPRRRFKFNRVPSHLAIIFTEQHLADTSLPALICRCCLLYGIPKLTFYDPWSIAKSRDRKMASDLLADWLEEQDNNNSNPSDDNVTFSINDQHYSIPKNRIEGCREGGPATKLTPQLSVHLLGEGDGRGSLVRAAKRLCVKVEQGDLTPDDISTKCISDTLAQDGVSEVDFLIKLGRVDSLMGYPPWSLRVTEMLFIKAAENFSEMRFLECLEQFSRREQRFGK